MREDYDHEPEHSAMVTQGSMLLKWMHPLQHKVEVPALPLDTSSQASVEGTEASM